MNTYTSLEQEVIDLSRMPEEHRRFLQRAYAAYEAGIDWRDFANTYTNGPENPALASGQRVSRAVAATPLYRALRDLEDRVGIASGKLRPSVEDEVERDPFDDSFVTIAGAAQQKGVSVQAVHKAIARDSLVSTNERPARVSQNSLDQWSVNEVRQVAGKVVIVGSSKATASATVLKSGEATVRGRAAIRAKGTVNAAAFRAGDRVEFAKFYDATFQLAYAACLMAVNDSEAAEDATAETYMDVWHERTAYPDDWKQALAWLARLCEQRAANSIRRPSRHLKTAKDASTGAQELPEEDDTAAAVHAWLVERSLERQESSESSSRPPKKFAAGSRGGTALQGSSRHS